MDKLDYAKVSFPSLAMLFSLMEVRQNRRVSKYLEIEMPDSDASPKW